MPVGGGTSIAFRFGRMRQFLLFLCLIVLEPIHAGQCASATAAFSSEDPVAVDCIVTAAKDAIVLGDPVRISLKTSGAVRAAYLDGIFLGAGGGSIQIRPGQSRWVTGMVRSATKVVFCATPLVVVTGSSMKVGTKLVRVRPTQKEEMSIRFLPENRDCDLGSSGCIASAVAGAIAILSSKPGLKGFSCNSKFHKAVPMAEYQVTDFSVDDDLDCEAVF